MTLVIPMVTWQDAREEWVVDIYSRLLGDRIIFLGTPIDEQIANLVVAELLHLESEQSDRDIAIYVNSPGGSVYAGLTIYDTMQFVRPDVQTMCVGIAMGMGALIVLGGTRGKRVALPHAKILLNQVSGGFEGEVSDIEIQAREVLALGRRLEEIIARARAARAQLRFRRPRAPVAPARVLLGELAQAGAQCVIAIASARPVALGRAVLPSRWGLESNQRPWD